MSACIEATGSRYPNGYGRTFRDGRMQLAHRVALEDKLGRPIADGMLACHTCDNRPCVNPDHLYEGTPQQNTYDMVRRGRHHYAVRSACSRGHEYTPENTATGPTGGRICRACRTERVREFRAKRRATA